MLSPKRTKFRRPHRGNLKGKACRGNKIAFGEYGLQAVEPCWLTARQIESVRVTVARKLKKVGKFYLRVFPDKPITKKPAETRMGKGKGNPEEWVFVVKRGRVLCEVSGLSELESRQVLQQAAYKLPMKTRVVKREHKIDAEI